MKNKTKHSDMT